GGRRGKMVLPVGLVVFALAMACKRERGSGVPGATARQGLASAPSGGLPAAWPGVARSCESLPATCGPSANDSCCRSLLVPGGTFKRTYDGVDFRDESAPATVSDFYLDKYEITVARFRAFIEAGSGTRTRPPAEGAGAHPRIAGSGWRSAWNGKLARDTAVLKAGLKCHPSYQSWTDEPGDNERKPVNCVDWYTAFAFCAW